MTKRNGNLWKMVAVVTTLVVLLVSVVVTFSQIGHQVTDNCEDIALIVPKVAEHETYITGQRIRETYIKEKVDKIELTVESIDAQQTELNTQQTAILNAIEDLKQ